VQRRGALRAHPASFVAAICWATDTAAALAEITTGDASTLLDRLLAAHPEQAFVRGLLRRDGEEWQSHYLSALNGAEPPGWQEQAWEYERITFAACRIRAAELAALCSTTGATCSACATWM